MFLRYLSDSEYSIFKDKDKLSFDDLNKHSKSFLKNCVSIPNMKKEISEQQLKLFIELLDNNGK